MQRIDGNAQSPLQLARVDDSVDPSFDESLAIEVIEHGSAVHCVSSFLGDIVIAGSDGVFDNLFVEDLVDMQHYDSTTTARTEIPASRETAFGGDCALHRGRVSRQ